ncbi:MAG TPA: PAS domain S-box protein [Thermodesulfobacteriota bacterium]|nr:PAS domain S-box protein [Thermodesulfobacteriota bacterium]
MTDDRETIDRLTKEAEELRLRLSRQKEREDDLERRIEQLSVCFRSIGDGVIVSDADGRIILINRKAEELTGWSAEEAAGKPVSEVLRLYHKDSLDIPIGVDGMVRETGEKLGLPRDTVLMTRGGKTLFISASIAPVHHEQKDLRGVVVAFRDISRLRETELGLIENEKKYRTIIENSYDLIYEVDSSGNILFVNPSCSELTGYAPSELQGKNAFDFMHPDDRPQVLSVFMNAVRNFTTEKATFRAIHKSGEYQWLECVGKPFLTATGEIRGVIITREISERKRREEEMLALNTLMKAVHRFLDLGEVYDVALDIIMKMENMDMAMIYLVDKEKKEAVVQASRNLPEFYIKKAGRIPYPKGLTWKIIVSGAIENIEDAQKDKEIGDAGRRLGHHSLLGIPIFQGSEVIGVIWFLSYQERKFSEHEVRLLSAMGDQIAIAIAKAKMLEEIKSAQEKLVQTEKLASLGQMVSSIAHEINNPLTPIMGYSQRLLTKPGLENAEKKSLEIINMSAQRVAKIIENLLSFSRNYRPQRTYQDINALVAESLDNRAHQLKLENIEVVAEFGKDLPRTMVDSNQVRQVFTNIIQNAEQAMSGRGGGSLRIATEIKNGNEIKITFEDDGPGFGKDAIAKLFDPFFTTKEPGKGTGLGLAVAYGIVKEHGGDIRAENREGIGAAIIVELPVLEEASPPEPAPEEKPAPRSRKKASEKRILVIEDEELVVDLIKGVLEHEDLTIDVARDGEEALAKAVSGEYDLIVCDIKMPVMGGIAFYNKINVINPQIARKVIFITGDPSSETMEFLNTTGKEYITKPFKVEKFKARVCELLTPQARSDA